MWPVFVHVGFPKCASTLLQRHVFPNLGGVRYISSKDDPGLYEALALRDFLGGEGARQAVLEAFKLSSAASGMPTLLSAEHFVMPGNCLQMSFPRPMPLMDSPEIMSLIERHFGERARILVVIRRQQDWLESWYQERVKRYETRRFGDLLGAADFAPILALLEYDKVIDDLMARFGPSRVFAVPFELIKSDEGVFFDKIAGFVGVTLPVLKLPVVKGRMKPQTIIARRNTNKALTALARVTGGDGPLDRACFKALKKIYAYDFAMKPFAATRAYDEIPPRLREVYSQSNRVVGQAVKCDLKALGYF